MEAMTITNTKTRTRKFMNKAIRIAKSLNWNVSVYDDCIEFQTYTNYGQDCLMTIDKVENYEELCQAIYNYYDDFDVSEQAYMWLDVSGHGKNGAPYEMIDVYNDMKEYEGKILELWRALYNAN
jgi:hypothetical protein